MPFQHSKLYLLPTLKPSEPILLLNVGIFLLSSQRMGRRSSEEYAAATGVLTGHTGSLRRPEVDLMILGAAGASVPRIGPRPQLLRLSDTRIRLMGETFGSR